jgi:site-specific recombinase XerD
MKVELELKHVQSWTDHLGRRRFRFRRGGYPRIELPVNADVNSPEFQAAYHAALRGEKTNAALASVAARGGSGTVNAAITAYLASTTFNDDYSPSTRSARRPMLNSVSRLVGTLPLAKMDTNWITRWLETAPSKIVKATRLGAIRPFLQWAIGVGLITVDPTATIKVRITASKGHHTWTDAEIEQYRARHPIGTRARLGLELLLAVAARRSDAIVLGRQHLRDGCLVFVQQKNRKRKPVTVEAPVSPELQAALSACPSAPEALTFLTTEWGRPFSVKAFNTQFRAWCDEAGLPQSCKPHGLRKAACRIMAESDCTVHEIKSVSGHRTLKEVERYTAAVDNKRLAIRARAKVAAATNVVPLAVLAGART